MRTRILTAASVLALLSACSSQPGPSAVDPVDTAYSAFRSGDFTAAESVYNGVLRANPGNQTALLGLAEVYEATGRLADAKDLYRKVKSARSGAIRVWDDGTPVQDGVTEVAMRRLGSLAHGMDSPARVRTPVMTAPVAAAPVVSAPSYVETTVIQQAAPAPMVYTRPAAPAPVSVMVEPQYSTSETGYGIDANGIVYYNEADAGIPAAEPYYAPQPVAPVYEPQPVAPAYQTYAPAPVVTEAPAVYQPMPAAPVQQYVPAPQSFEYEAAPVRYQEAPAQQYVPAPLPAAVVQPQAPVYSPAPVPVARTAPAPSPAPSGALPRTQPGYAVVNGDLIYISAEDIASGRMPAGAQFAPTGRATAPALPLGPESLNGIRIPNLN